MKKIGLIGGMSWESSQVYYKIINETVKQRLGGFHSARCVMESVDFSTIEKLQGHDDWDALNKEMVEAALNLEHAKADLIVLCTNTMHLCSEAITDNTNIPFLHIAEATARAIKSQQIEKVLLLGTRFTMEKDFYKEILTSSFGIEVAVPGKKERDEVHRIIYEELVKGQINPDSKKTYQHIIHEAASSGVEGVILGCTEIPLLIQDSYVDIPTFDTTRIHAEAAVEFALQ